MLANCVLLASAAEGESVSESENVVYYEDMEPVTDVYLQPASDFSDFQYEAGRYKMLSTDGTWDGGLLETLCVWNREAF